MKNWHLSLKERDCPAEPEVFADLVPAISQEDAKSILFRLK
jgi:hypothetical protein